VDEEQEQNFTVRGGLLWFHHVLVAAVEVSKSYQVRSIIAAAIRKLKGSFRSDYILVIWN